MCVSSNYNELKAALLKRYRLTEEGFRIKFRREKPQKGETFRQFVTRISRYLDRWIELSETEKGFQALRDLLIQEQVLSVASKELRVFLKERQPQDVDQLAKLAEQYLEVHGKLYEHWAQSGQPDRFRSPQQDLSKKNQPGKSIRVK